MPRPSRSTLIEPEIGAVFLVPLHDDAARHGRRFERHDAVETSLADDHAARVLSEMAWHILQGDHDVEKFAHSVVAEVEPRFEELLLLRVFGIVKTPHRRKA